MDLPPLPEIGEYAGMDESMGALYATVLAYSRDMKVPVEAIVDSMLHHLGHARHHAQPEQAS